MTPLINLCCLFLSSLITLLGASPVLTLSRPADDCCTVCLRHTGTKPEGFEPAPRTHPCVSSDTNEAVTLNLKLGENEELPMEKILMACDLLCGRTARRLNETIFNQDATVTDSGRILNSQTAIISGAAGGIVALVAGVTGIVMSRRKDEGQSQDNSSNDSAQNKDSWGASVVMSFASDGPNAESPEIVDAPSPMENESDMTSVTLTMF